MDRHWSSFAISTLWSSTFHVSKWELGSLILCICKMKFEAFSVNKLFKGNIFAYSAYFHNISAYNWIFKTWNLDFYYLLFDSKPVKNNSFSFQTLKKTPLKTECHIVLKYALMLHTIGFFLKKQYNQTFFLS